MFTKQDLWKLKNWTKFSVENCNQIMTISKFSKTDLISQYKLDKNIINVAYPGYDKEKFKVQNSKLKLKEITDKYKVSDNYIIYIGTIQPRKNLERLIEAFARIAKSGQDLELLIIGKTSGEGKQGWMYEDTLKAPENFDIVEKVKFLGFVPIEDLPILLSGAKTFILPSLWEGFGIPAVEAMASGVPVIVSNVSSLPEIVGKAGLLVDPYSVDQIEQAIRLMVTDKKLRQKYSRAGIARAKEFSWSKMAKRVLEVFGKK